MSKRLILSLLVILTMMVASSCSDNDNLKGGSGLLEADEIIISSETSGRVTNLYFDEGVFVNSNDTLMEIDPSRLQLDLQSAIASKNVARSNLVSAGVQVKQAEQAYDYALKERDRIATLVKSGTGTQKQLDALEFELTRAELNRESAATALNTIKAEIDKIDAGIDKIKRAISDCYPVSPISGIVTEQYIEKGELLSPGKAIVKISSTSSFWVKVYLPSGDFAGITLGEKAVIDTESGQAKYDGTVIWTSQEAEFTPKNIQTKKSRSNLVYAVKVKIDNPDENLKIGMPVFVTIGQ